MPIELTPTGEIVTRRCLLRTPGICLHPNGPGPVLLYQDRQGRLYNVCKACAEKAFSVGDWLRPSGSEKLVSEYRLLKDHCESLGEAIAGLLQAALSSAGIRSNSISYRVKPIDSLRQKLNRKEDVFELADIQDLVGVRVITPFADDVDRIGEVVKQDFEILSSSSISKPDYQREDSFGYPSVHYVIRLPLAKRSLPEYRMVSNLNAEVQIRSVLQQAWSDLSHELQYKRGTEIPNNMIRQVDRLAALLELADQEFIGIRNKTEESTAGIERKSDKEE